MVNQKGFVSHFASQTHIAFYSAIFSLLSMVSYAEELIAEEPMLSVPAVIRLMDEADAPAQAAGVIIHVMAKEGDQVTQGDLLAKLDDSEAKLAVRAAIIDVEIAQQLSENDVPLRYAIKAAEVADAELRRSQESIRQFAKSVSQSQIDVEKLTAEKARLEQERSEQDQQAARLELKLRHNRLMAAKVVYEHRQIRAPITGVVVEVEVYPGAWLEQGQKAFRVVDVARLRAEAFVDADQAVKLTVGSIVKIGDDNGKITFISPEVDPINRQVRVVAEIDNQARKLRPGDRTDMFVFGPSETVSASTGSDPRGSSEQ